MADMALAPTGKNRSLSERRARAPGALPIGSAVVTMTHVAHFGQNRGYIEELYASYLADPNSVSEAWRDYFSDFPLEPAPSRAATARGAAGTEPAGAEPLSGI